MANESHLAMFARGVKAWNSWREQNRVGIDSRPDLSGADLARPTNLSFHDLLHAYRSGEADIKKGANISKANLSYVNLSGADLSRQPLQKTDLISVNLADAKLTNAYLVDAHLADANLTGADLYDATLLGAHLADANLTEANLTEADLRWADLSDADLTGADLSKANLSQSILVKTTLDRATLEGCRIYGISAWDLNLEGTDQRNLVISPKGEPDITVDDLEVAQFIYLLLNNKKIRNVIDTMTSKAVLILGNFSEKRKAVLELIREQLRNHNYLPILFDFEGSHSQNVTNTVITVARLSRFVIADITDPRTVPYELAAIVKHAEEVPIKPLFTGTKTLTLEALPTGYKDLLQQDQVLALRHYRDRSDLLASFENAIIEPAENKFNDLQVARLRALEEKLPIKGTRRKPVSTE